MFELKNIPPCQTFIYLTILRVTQTISLSNYINCKCKQDVKFKR